MSYDIITPMMIIYKVNGQKKISTGETVCMLHIAEFHYDMIQCMYTIFFILSTIILGALNRAGF